MEDQASSRGPWHGSSVVETHSFQKSKTKTKQVLWPYHRLSGEKLIYEVANVTIGRIIS